MKLKNTENFFVLGLFLAVTGLISGLLLAVFSGIVKEPIAAAELRNTNKALEQILPPFDNQPSQDKYEIDGITFLGAVRDGKLVALAASGAKKGYAGPVRALVGLELDGKIRAILITKQNETPGLGANVCARKFKKTIFNLFDKRPEGLAPNPFLDQFDGMAAKKDVTWKVKKDGGDIEYVTGATVTSRAITALTDEIAQCFLAHRGEIIAKLTPAGGK